MKNPPKRVFVVVSYRTDQANSVCYGAALTSAALTGSAVGAVISISGIYRLAVDSARKVLPRRRPVKYSCPRRSFLRVPGT